MTILCNAQVKKNNVILWFSVMCVWISVASIYWRSATHPDGIGGGDSAELALTALDHGTPHPPGYPLLFLLLSSGYRILSYYQVNEWLDSFFFWFSIGTASSAATFYSLFLCRWTNSLLVGT